MVGPQAQSPRPLMQLLFVAGALRCVLVAGSYATGDGSFALPIILAAMVYHLLWLGALGSSLTLVGGYAHRHQLACYVTSAVILVLSTVLAVVDLTLLRLAGSKLTWQLLATYSVGYLTHPDTREAITADLPLALLGAATLAGLIAALAHLYRDQSARYGRRAPLLCLATCTCGLLIGLYYDTPYYEEIRPPELNLLTPPRSSRLPTQQAQARALELLTRLRGRDIDDVMQPFLGQLPPRALPAGGKAPSANRAAGTEALSTEPPQHPDIFFVVVESLRGGDLKFTGSPAPAHTPNIDALADKSLVLPRLIANGQPTAQGFFILNTSVIPPLEGEVGAVFKAQTFDALPVILAQAFGYETTIHWASTPGKHNTKYWSEKWYQELVYPRRQSGQWHPTLSDIVFYSRVVSFIQARDEEQAKNQNQNQNQRPLFMYIQNADTHYPAQPETHYFETKAQKKEAARFRYEGDDYAGRYKRTLEWTDQNLGVLLDFLVERSKRRNTVIVLTGDHAKEATNVIAHQVRRIPHNGLMHVGGLIYASSGLIPDLPRVYDAPSSLADLAPTILHLLGYAQPFTTFGQSLLVQTKKRFAIAVSGGFLRLDTPETTVFSHGSNVGDTWQVPFHAADFTQPVQPQPYEGPWGHALHDLVHFWSHELDRREALARQP